MCNLSREFKSNLFCFKFSLVTPRDLKQFTYTRDYYYIAYLPTYLPTADDTRWDPLVLTWQVYTSYWNAYENC